MNRRDARLIEAWSRSSPLSNKASAKFLNHCNFLLLAGLVEFFDPVLIQSIRLFLSLDVLGIAQPIFFAG
jgi:hypothetical protein